MQPGSTLLLKALLLGSLAFVVPPVPAAGPADEPPIIPVGLDAYRMWDM